MIEENFSSQQLIAPSKTNSINLGNAKEQTFIYLIFMSLALINIVALFKYWIEKNWRKYMIYKLCGAKKIDIYILIIFEALVLAVFSVILGGVLYYLSTPILNMLKIEYILNLNEICILLLLILILIYFNLHRNAVKLSKVNARYIGKR